jgi:hypothetical protein
MRIDIGHLNPMLLLKIFVLGISSNQAVILQIHRSNSLCVTCYVWHSVTCGIGTIKVWTFLAAPSYNCEKRLLASSCVSVRPSVRPHGITRFPLEGFSWSFVFWVFFENLSRKFNFNWNQTRITGTLHEDMLVLLAFVEWLVLTLGDSFGCLAGLFVPR